MGAQVRARVKHSKVAEVIGSYAALSRRQLLGGALALSTMPAFAASARLQYPGVNLAGGEFGKGDRLNRDYVYPSIKQVQYYGSRGFKLLRVPFRSNRVFRDGRAHSPDIDPLHALIDAAASRDMVVLLDLHEFGIKTDGSLWTASDDDRQEFFELWQRLAQLFGTRSNVWFGVMNEPHRQAPEEWFRLANSAIAGIRSSGSDNPVLVMGSKWGTADGWIVSGNARASEVLRDPAQRLTIEVHQYLDKAGGKPERAGPVPGLGATALKDVTGWARRAGRKLFLGEFGVTADPAYLREGRALLSYLSANTDVWIGYAYWAGGLWWAEGRSNYPFSLEPRDLDAPVDRPQMRMLREYM